MNYIERWVDRKLRRLSWKMTKLEHSTLQKETSPQIVDYRWIIKDTEEQIIYDTEKDGYEGLNNFPVVIESLDLIANTKEEEAVEKEYIDKPEVIFTFEPQLWSIFPYEKLEEMCMS